MIKLTSDDFKAFEHDGYLVVPNVIPADLCTAASEVISRFLDIDLDNPNTWYGKELGRNGIVPVHQHQAVWNTRQHPNVHSLFAQIFGQENLWVRLDRLSFKPPSREAESEESANSYIHVDAAPATLKTLRLQGILYLNDTAENQGAFCCVPSLFREKSLLEQKRGLVFSAEDLADHDILNIPGQAGTMIIWNSLLPHSGAINTSDQPRLAQYISMMPEETEEDREIRIQLWKNRQAPERWRGLPSQQDPEPGEPAQLTKLGRKLLGLDSW
ncbi:MAG: phytanoyl-CoA dioxygenase family protein [Endozoicomonas sp.]